MEKEWDIDNPAHRRPRIEVMEPEEPPPRLHRVAINVCHHRRRSPAWLVPPAVAVVGLLLLWRYPFGFLMLGVLAGRETLKMFLFVAVVLAVLSSRDRPSRLSLSVGVRGANAMIAV